MQQQVLFGAHALGQHIQRASCPDIKRGASELQAPRFFGKLSAASTVQPMSTVGESRRENLESLIEQAGTLEAVAVAAETSAVYLSQIRNQAKDAKTKRPREMGSAMARRLEAAYKLPDGWMDQKHASRIKLSLADEEAQFLGVEDGGRQHSLTPTTLGDSANMLAGAAAAIPDGTRRLLSQAFAELIVSGPNPKVASAIDAMAPDVVVWSAAGSLASLAWAKTAREVAMQHKQADVRELLLDFLTVVEDQMAKAATPPVGKSTETPLPP